MTNPIAKTLLRAATLIAAITLVGSAAHAQTKIYIDAGHGGTDPGAVNSGVGTQEKARVLFTSLKTRDWLNADSADAGGGGNWSVRLSRSTDVTLTLSARSTDSNNWGAARFLSIHQNSNAGTPATGTETFRATGSSAGLSLATPLQEEAIIAWGLTNRGVKEANFSVLVNTTAPAALTEMGFINNTNVDHVKCASDTWCDAYAKAMMFGIQRNYGFAKYTPGSAVEVIVDNGTSAFTASANWYTSTSTPGYYGSNYHVRPTEAISDAASWKGNVPTAGTYTVYVRYTSGANRPASAPYIVYHTGGSSNVPVNQQSGGGAWVNVGNYSFASGSTSTRVALSCWTTAGYYAVADAVRYVKQ